MPDFFVWCAYCHNPHDLSVEVCPLTNRSVRGTYPPPGTGKPFIGARVGGRYLVRSPIGEGGMGAVFEAERIEDGRTFALKVLKPKNSDWGSWRLEREARLCSAVIHPNVCRVHEVGVLEDGAPYLVMERLLGETLRSRLNRDRRLSVAETLGIFVQVLSGLAAAHACGIVHRDVKPQNIFLIASESRPPPVKVLDFGLSKRPVRESIYPEPESQVTEVGVAVGTLEYMSPEQLSAGRVDARADIYSCGVTLYETLTGRRPFAGRTPREICVAKDNDSFVMPSSLRRDVPPVVDSIITRAIKGDRAKRFADAPEFLRALSTLVAREPHPRDARAAARTEVDLDVDWADKSDEITATIPSTNPPMASDEALTVPRFEKS